MNVNSQMVMNLNINKRVQSVIFEMWYNMIIYVPFFILFGALESSILGSPNGISLITILFSVMLITLLNKDFFNGQSVIHRRLGYQVVNADTLLPVNKTRCMIRNLTAPIWFVEVFFILINPEKRLGDMIAGTKLIEVEPTNPESIIDEIKTIKADRATIFPLLLATIFALLFNMVFSI
jgi:uncharacterized RDD family membrane protein YckC